MTFALPSDAAHLAEILNAASPRSIGDVAALLALAASSAVVLYKPWNRPDPYRNVWFEKPQLRNGMVSRGRTKTRNIAAFLEESVRTKYV
jgi:hypothetical protein